jgi:dTDP-4-amino-4,6-dideoxygalactose transaminase
LAALGVRPGDEVITPPNSFIASTAAIVHLGAKPVFVDVLADQNIDPEKIAAAITPRTKAIMPVHLTGRMAKMDLIAAIADRYDLPIIEDAAQAIGSKYQNRPSGGWGKVGCFSTHPLKNLNACGDGGFLVTNDDAVASEIRRLRNHGLRDRNTADSFGYVSRMDEIQAAILNFRIERLNQVTEKRQKNAALYREFLDASKVFIPAECPNEYNTYHTFVIQVNHRDRLRNILAENGVETSIHYPVPLHLQPAAMKYGYGIGDFPITEIQSNKILTLPIHQYLNEDEIIHIANLINCD